MVVLWRSSTSLVTFFHAGMIEMMEGNFFSSLLYGGILNGRFFFLDERKALNLLTGVFMRIYCCLCNRVVAVHLSAFLSLSSFNPCENSFLRIACGSPQILKRNNLRVSNQEELCK